VIIKIRHSSHETSSMSIIGSLSAMSLAMCKCIDKAVLVLSHVLTLVMETEFVSRILFENCKSHLQVMGQQGGVKQVSQIWSDL